MSDPAKFHATIYVDKPTWLHFQALCKLRNTSASAVLRDAIRHIITCLESGIALETPLAHLLERDDT
jgi:hypothetical protein